MKDQIIIGTAEDTQIHLNISKLVESRMVIQATSGGGKSGLVRVVCERVANSVPFIVLDREGEYATLREKVDLILVGPNGDIPTDLRSAELLARKLVELRTSAVVDLSDLKINEQRVFVARFCSAMVALPKELWHPTIVVIDEAQVFCPEKGGNAKDVVSTQPVIDLIAQGRKRGFSPILATQRFSKVHNDALAELKNVFIGSTWLDADQKKAGDYLGLTGNDRRGLRDVPRQTFYAFGPALSERGVNQVRIDNAESTFPKAGQIGHVKLPKASEAIQTIISQIDDLPEVAEQEKKDVASLQADNRELQRQLAERPTVPEPVEVIKTVEVPVMSPETLTAATTLADAISLKIVDLISDLEVQIGEFEHVRDGFAAAIEKVTGQPVPTSLPRQVAAPKTEAVTFAKRIAPSASAASVQLAPRDLPAITTTKEPALSTGGLNKAESQILRAFYWTRDEESTPAKIGFYSDYSHTSGSFKNACSTLRSKGLLYGWQITEEGIDTAAAFAEAKPTGRELREWLRPKLDKCANEILDVLINNRGYRISPEDIAGQTETKYSPTSGSFKNAMSRLRSLEAAEGYAAEGVKAADVFFE